MDRNLKLEKTDNNIDDQQREWMNFCFHCYTERVMKMKRESESIGMTFTYIEEEEEKKTQRNRWLRRMANENEIQSTSWPRQKKIDKWFDCLVCLCVCEREKNVSVFLFFIYDDYDGAEKNGFVEFSVRFHQEKKIWKQCVFGRQRVLFSAKKEKENSVYSALNFK